MLSKEGPLLAAGAQDLTWLGLMPRCSLVPRLSLLRYLSAQSSLHRMSAVPTGVRGVAIPREVAGTKTMPNEHHGLDPPAENGAPGEIEELKKAANTASASPAQEGLATVRGSTRESHVGPHGSRLA